MFENSPTRERFLEQCTPHYLSYLPYYLFFIWFLCSSFLLFYQHDTILYWMITYLHEIPSFFVPYLILVIWWTLVFSPLVFFSFTRLEKKWMITLIVFSTLGMTVMYHSPLPLLSFGHSTHAIMYMITGVTIAGIGITEWLRMSHRYYFTNYRVFKTQGILRTHTKWAHYSWITNILPTQHFLGKRCNFATLVPLSFIDIFVENTVEGNESNQFRDQIHPEFYSIPILYGVPTPEKIKNLIYKEKEKLDSLPFFQDELRSLKSLKQLLTEKRRRK